MRTSRQSLSSRALIAGTVAIAALSGCSSSSSGGDATNPDAQAVHSETFHDVTPAQNRRAQRTLPLMRGVASNTYQDGDLIVTFKSTATKLDQHNVENIVQASKNPPAKTASPSPRGKRK
ncbi:MAG TPA: hypothetical protein VHD81_06070 [Mycobacteriales bacterium]|nr:hypothetical protein [Mycobacteriales bacterium]